MKAIILIHEIYGKNNFIDMQCNKYQDIGFDVYCPDLLNNRVFSYNEVDEAYTYFYANVGLNAYRLIWNLLETIKLKYEKIYIIGYSVGATLAWQCSENPHCSGVVCCYGSRIRDYMWVKPKCPVLIIFAKEDSFDVYSAKNSLEQLPNTSVALLQAKHGFMDLYSEYYDATQAEITEKKILNFII